MYKVITFAPSLTALRLAIAGSDAPFARAVAHKNNGLMAVGRMMMVKYNEDESIKDMLYIHQHKSKTFSNGDASIAMVKMSADQIENFVKPMVDAGIMECLAKEPGELYCADSRPWDNLNLDEWDKVYSAWPEGKDPITIKVFGKDVPVVKEFFGDVA